MDNIDFQQQGPNTRLTYMYRDAGNYKTVRSVVLAGQMTEKQVAEIEKTLDDTEFFIPSQVGLFDLQNQLNQGDWDDENDHPWHTIIGLEHTNDPQTGFLSVDELHAKFLAAAWDERKDPQYGP